MRGDSLCNFAVSVFPGLGMDGKGRFVNRPYDGERPHPHPGLPPSRAYCTTVFSGFPVQGRVSNHLFQQIRCSNRNFQIRRSCEGRNLCVWFEVPAFARTTVTSFRSGYPISQLKPSICWDRWFQPRPHRQPAEVPACAGTKVIPQPFHASAPDIPAFALNSERLGVYNACFNHRCIVIYLTNSRAWAR